MEAAREKGRFGLRALGVVGSVVGALSLLLLNGCREPTEIIVVVDSDLTPSLDFDEIQFQLPGQFGGGSFAVGSSMVLPATMGFVPAEGGRPKFDIMVVAVKNVFQPMPTMVVTRRVSDIPFVSGEMKALSVSLLRRCLCEGTSCPNASEPECRDITAPKLTDFDEDHLPRLQAQAP